jgi:peptidoglycan/LPS O-acetylase OafA/YrhL
MPPRAEPGGKRIADIEILRACGVLLVMAAHLLDLVPWAYWQPYLRQVGSVGCWQGVDLFFAVSGFVIARGLLPQLGAVARQAGAPAQWRAAWPLLRRFWARRIWRLWPAAWLWLAIVLVATAWPIGRAAFRDTQTNFWAMVAGIFLVANFRNAVFLSHFQYYGATVTYWSLSLEEQFYLVLPWVILVAGRFLPWLLAAAIAVQFPLARGTLGSMVRTDALMWGVLIAMLERSAFFHRWEPRWLRTQPIARGALVWTLLAVLTQVGGDAAIHGPFEVGLVALVAAALVWLAAFDAGYIAGALPGRRALMAIAERSYTLYLVHLPCFLMCAAVAHALTQVLAWQLVIAVLCASVSLPLLTEATYRFVEMPFRRRAPARREAPSCL